MSAPNGRVYRVVLSGAVQQRLKDLHRRAKEQGQGPQFITALRWVLGTLRTYPLEFGEARFVLHHLNLEMRVGSSPPLVVVYAVHRARPIVFVQNFQLLTGSDL